MNIGELISFIITGVFGFLIYRLGLSYRRTSKECVERVQAKFIGAEFVSQSKGGPVRRGLFEYEYRSKVYKSYTENSFQGEHAASFIPGELYTIYINPKQPTFIRSKIVKFNLGAWICILLGGFLFYGMLLMLILTLAGCRKQNVNQIKDPKAVVQEYLEDKYGSGYKVLSIDKVNAGQNFAEYIYMGEACDVAGMEFDFTMNAKDDIKDNYPKTQYAMLVQMEVSALFDKYGFDFLGGTWKFLQKAEKYSDYETYVSGNNVVFLCDIMEEIGGNGDKIGALYALATELKDRGYYFYISADAFGVKELLVYAEGTDLISKEEWEQRTMTE